MPWKHYKWDPDFYTVDTSFMTVYNNNTVAEDLFATVANLYTKYNGLATDSIAYVTGTSNNVNPLESREIYYPDAGFILDTSVNDTCATFQICHTIETDDPYFYGYNDTVSFDQILCNYYAYDDGSAEAAYGIFGSGAQVAYQFDIAQEDSIRSIKIHWAPSVDDVSQSLLRLTIWEDDGAGKPGNVLYQTEALFGESPQYSDEKNGFTEYFLKDLSGDDGLRIAVDGTYYIGWLQSDPDILNVGFDRNLDNSDRIFYNTGAFWTNTGFTGSLMMRPVFVSDMDGFLSTPEVSQNTFEATVYPNPTNGQLNVDVDGFGRYSFEILSMSGQLLNKGELNGTIDVSELITGMYLIRLQDEYGTFKTLKFLKR